ncbi:hypothetical protein PAECIP112173_04667 [Paenibacillus sp. JJ-100]|nr:hypothetical protein PAECIP112173_04667 [Paenibacillus sp. JJ-100]
MPLFLYGEDIKHQICLNVVFSGNIRMETALDTHIKMEAGENKNDNELHRK